MADSSVFDPMQAEVSALAFFHRLSIYPSTLAFHKKPSALAIH